MMNNKNSITRPLCLSGRGVTKIFGAGQKSTLAVDHVDFDFHEGELISIVGESGSGKTTLSKMLLGLLSVTEGEILFRGEPRDISTRQKRKQYWKGIQAIFQDPFSSLNPFHSIGHHLERPLRLHGDLLGRLHELGAELGNALGVGGREQQGLALLRALLQSRQSFLLL